MKQIDFFISYSHKDEEIVKSVVESLESAGAKCWYAPRDVVGRYAKAIVDAISHSKIFLLCLSRNAAASEHVLNEVEMAYNKKKTMDNNLLIEPLCLEPLDLDSPELDEIMYYIRRINFISPTNLNSSKAIAQEGLSQISYENSPSKKAHKSKGGANPSFLCANKAYFLPNQATATSNKATPKRPVSSLLQSLRILYANARRKNCVSVFRFPRVRNFLNP